MKIGILLLGLFLVCCHTTNEEDVVNPNEEVFKFVEQMPEFPGGASTMMKYIQTNLIYPQTAKDNKIEGTVVVQFVVEKDGTIINVRAVRLVGGGCSEEAIRIVSTMPKWIPGKHNGREVPVSFTLPIKFKLEE